MKLACFPMVGILAALVVGLGLDAPLPSVKGASVGCNQAPDACAPLALVVDERRSVVMEREEAETSARPGTTGVERHAGNDAVVLQHDGFYLQSGLGVAYWSSGHPLHEVFPEVTLKGWGVAYGIRCGWTWRGFTAGAGLAGRTIWAEERTGPDGQNEIAKDVRALINAGPFVDWYLDPRGGFHLGVMLGFGPKEEDASLNYHLWVGYDFRIKGDWWIGLEPRYFAGASWEGTASSVEVLLVATHN